MVWVQATTCSLKVLRSHVLRVALASLLLTVSAAAGQEAASLEVPWDLQSFDAGEGCRWHANASDLSGLPHNDHYLAPPGPGVDWQQWLANLRCYRQGVRDHLGDAAGSQIEIRFDGVRAWVRTARPWAFAADLAPGESIVVRGEGRWAEGTSRLCLAMDFCDRKRSDQGDWCGWSTVLASAPIAQDGKWHDFQIPITMPAFDHAQRWARPILGMDGTFDPKPGALTIRKVRVVLPSTSRRAEPWKRLLAQVKRPAGFDDSIYRREDLKWMASNFVCGFVFMYDRAVWDPEKAQYRIGPLCEEAKREFGGYDSVVLWHAYPRIGADGRNQFDFFRDMPGGLDGLRGAVREFHQRRVKVFLPYNPWDTGTDRPQNSDELALAKVTAATEADGIFLDTMLQAPASLRQAVDARRPGVAFEPEGHPSIQEMQRCSGSWAQWLQPFPGIGVLHLKWLEPRHMQHQIRRWDESHQEELAAAWLNGSGILVWENIFGYWNPWNAEDRATLRRMAPVLRHFASLFIEGEWLPCIPTQAARVHVSYWKGPKVRLWTIVNQSGKSVELPIPGSNDESERFFDLWRGTAILPHQVGGKTRLTVPIERFGTVAAVHPDAIVPGLAELLEKQQKAAVRPLVSGINDPHVRAKSVAEPKTPPRCLRGKPIDTNGMLRVAGASQTFLVRHQRRECGCFPDPGTLPNEWKKFLTGNPFSETMEHRVAATVEECWIDARPVSNGQFNAFLKATGYKPQCSDNFLRHWRPGGGTADLKDSPVVCVDIADARAYAAWKGQRLPTEWEWQRAAEQFGDLFFRADVHEWTESERDDGHTRFVMLRGASRYQAEGSTWYFPGGRQPVQSHAKFLLLYPGLDRCRTIGFRCVAVPPK